MAGTLQTIPKPNGNGFSHITPREAEIDKLMENDGGFSSLAHYCQTAAKFQAKRAIDPSELERYTRWGDAVRISRAIANPDGMFETNEPDGGALIPPGFVKEVFDKARFRDTPFSRCRTVIVNSNTCVLPGFGETSRVDGSRWGGLLSYWELEAQQLVNTHPKLFADELRLKKLTAMVPVTSELFEDSGGLFESMINETVPKEFAYQTNEGMINGGGAGRLLGVVNSPCTITIPKDTGQAAGTVSFTNLQNMWTQSHGASRANMVWYAQEDIDPDNVALPVSATTAWAGPQPSPCFKGRPFVPLENCQPIGTPGDVVLGDWSQYVLILAGMRNAVSMHFRFDYIEHYFRFIWRVDGQPLWQAPLTPPHSTIQKSPFLVLATR